MVKARELQQQQHYQKPQQMQMQQLLLQRHAQPQQQQQQQQRREGTQLLNGTANGLGGGEPLMKENPVSAIAATRKVYDENFRFPRQRDSLDDTAVKVPSRISLIGNNAILFSPLLAFFDIR